MSWGGTSYKAPCKSFDSVSCSCCSCGRLYPLLDGVERENCSGQINGVGLNNKGVILRLVLSKGKSTGSNWQIKTIRTDREILIVFSPSAFITVGYSSVSSTYSPIPSMSNSPSERLMVLMLSRIQPLGIPGIPVVTEPAMLLTEELVPNSPSKDTAHERNRMNVQSA